MSSGGGRGGAGSRRGAGASRGTGARKAAAAATLGVVFAAALLWVHAPALDGDFASDDHFYIVSDPYVHELSAANVRAILDPWGTPAALTLNYAPLHLLAHALEWRAFGRSTRGWHVVNLVAHLAVTALLGLCFLRSGIRPGLTAFLCGVFAFHPANVEAVAWIFQLKTLLATGLALAAFRLHPGRPAAAAAAFGLALLAKLAAVFVLPAVALRAWLHRADAAPRWGWLALWAVLLAALLVPAFAAFGQQAHPALAFADLGTQVRTIGAVAARYAQIAATASGLSTFHEPARPASWLDPRWLAGLVLLAAATGRALHVLRRGREEAVYWALAAGAFLPVSQLVPFQNPVADRYLYGLLPGLLGVLGLALQPALAALEEREGRRVRTLAAAVGLLVCLGLGVEAHGRAAVFAGDAAMSRDAARHYPLGSVALLLRAREAARRGDGAGAARALSGAIDRGYADLTALLRDPTWEPVRRDPGFAACLTRLARLDVERFAGRERLHPHQRVQLAVAYDQLGQRGRARAVLEPALDDPGPFGPVVRALHEALEREPGAG